MFPIPLPSEIAQQSDADGKAGAGSASPSPTIAGRVGPDLNDSMISLGSAATLPAAPLSAEQLAKLAQQREGVSSLANSVASLAPQPHDASAAGGSGGGSVLGLMQAGAGGAAMQQPRQQYVHFSAPVSYQKPHIDSGIEGAPLNINPIIALSSRAAATAAAAAAAAAPPSPQPALPEVEGADDHPAAETGAIPPPPVSAPPPPIASAAAAPIKSSGAAGRARADDGKNSTADVKAREQPKHVLIEQILLELGGDANAAPTNVNAIYLLELYASKRNVKLQLITKIEIFQLLLRLQLLDCVQKIKPAYDASKAAARLIAGGDNKADDVADKDKHANELIDKLDNDIKSFFKGKLDELLPLSIKNIHVFLQDNHVLIKSFLTAQNYFQYNNEGCDGVEAADEISVWEQWHQHLCIEEGGDAAKDSREKSMIAMRLLTTRCYKLFFSALIDRITKIEAVKIRYGNYGCPVTPLAADKALTAAEAKAVNVVLDGQEQSDHDTHKEFTAEEQATQASVFLPLVEEHIFEILAVVEPDLQKLLRDNEKLPTNNRCFVGEMAATAPGRKALVAQVKIDREKESSVYKPGRVEVGRLASLAQPPPVTTAPGKIGGVPQPPASAQAAVGADLKSPSPSAAAPARHVNSTAVLATNSWWDWNNVKRRFKKLTAREKFASIIGLAFCIIGVGTIATILSLATFPLSAALALGTLIFTGICAVTSGSIFSFTLNKLFPSDKLSTFAYVGIFFLVAAITAAYFIPGLQGIALGFTVAAFISSSSITGGCFTKAIAGYCNPRVFAHVPAEDSVALIDADQSHDLGLRGVSNGSRYGAVVSDQSAPSKPVPDGSIASGSAAAVAAHSSIISPAPNSRSGSNDIVNSGAGKPASSAPTPLGAASRS